MKVVDFHIHPNMERARFKPWLFELCLKASPELVKIFTNSITGKRLVEFLDTQEVDYGVILAETTPITGTVENEFISNLARDEARLIPFASINPNTDSEPLNIFKRCVEEMGHRGLKLWPSYQFFYPHDPVMYPLYSLAQEKEIPVMFHIGSSKLVGAKLKYCDPIYLDDIARDFPELTIIMAHSGRGFWYDKAFHLSTLHENIYMEISGLPPDNLLKYFPDLEKNADKIIFGSDIPTIPSIKRNVEKIRNLPLKTATIEKILGLNANKILGLF
ncbi:MAG: amidohydrolase family protein [Thermodesulfobacteriota bacterium]|nr:amidohydrolase family protein [Thermodesulfobacteriota bacterium]